MTWSNEGSAPKFLPGGVARHTKSGDNTSTTVVVAEIGQYNQELRDRYYLVHFPDEKILPAWESDMQAVVRPTQVQQISGNKYAAKALLSRFRETIRKSQHAKRWLDEEGGVLKNMLLDTAVPAALWGSVCATFVGSGIVCLITAMAVAGGPNQPSGPWPPLGWFFVSTMVIGLATWIVFGTRTYGRSEELRSAKRKERMQDPLWERADLIVQAARELSVHCDRYEAWQSDEELREPDEELASRYQSFLTAAYKGLDAAINDFINATTLARRQVAYIKAHPALGETQSKYLSELMTLLNHPLGLPAVLDLVDARETLDAEEAFAQALKQSDGVAIRAEIDEVLAQTEGKGIGQPGAPS